ncbi:MAG TPA: BON domain-containing protein [Thermoanaerobaculia bacterium]|nr:BON domain-containing protein [Thermoanaerobaculia bacterium]
MRHTLWTPAITLLSLFIVAMPAAAADRDVLDLTPLFRDRGVAVDRLQVFDVAGIVIIRGRTADRLAAEEAGRVARQLGYARVANLVEIAEPADDAAIIRKAERELTTHRSLDGCRFRLASSNGVVRIGGLVRDELQKDVARQLVRSIDGVREVRIELRKF